MSILYTIRLTAYFCNARNMLLKFVLFATVGLTVFISQPCEAGKIFVCVSFYITFLLVYLMFTLIFKVKNARLLRLSRFQHVRHHRHCHAQHYRNRLRYARYRRNLLRHVHLLRQVCRKFD